MRIAVTGASGFIGARLCDAARARGHAVITVGRSSGERRWDPMSGPAPLEGADAVVHLAGEPVAEGRWSRAKKDRIRDSRVTGTRNLVAGLRAASVKTLVCASATGPRRWGRPKTSNSASICNWLGPARAAPWGENSPRPEAMKEL